MSSTQLQLLTEKLIFLQECKDNLLQATPWPIDGQYGRRSSAYWGCQCLIVTLQLETILLCSPLTLPFHNNLFRRYYALQCQFYEICHKYKLQETLFRSNNTSHSIVLRHPTRWQHQGGASWLNVIKPSVSNWATRCKDYPSCRARATADLSFIPSWHCVGVSVDGYLTRPGAVLTNPLLILPPHFTYRCFGVGYG